MSSPKTPKDKLSRRGFLRGVAVGGIGSVAAHEAIAQEFISVGSLDDWEASLNGGGTTTPPVTTDPETPTDTNPPVTDGPTFPESDVAIRRDIYTLPEGGQAIASLRRGIAAMKQRPASDPTSWWFQANVHAGSASPQMAPCQHSNRYFLSWHRMYLYFFERILRAASGDPSLTLPYWDYSIPGRAALPASVRLPADQNQNPLYWQNRNPFFNGGGALPPHIVETERTLRAASFDGQIGFNRALESQPHNGVHVQIGGSMAGVATAGQDPIFWMHHCNVDRQWNRWVSRGGSRRNPNDIDFMTQRYNFYNESGTLVSILGEDILETPRLGYRYDDDPAQPVGFDVAAAQIEAPQSFQTVTRTLANGETVTEVISSQPVAMAAMVEAPAPVRASVTLAESSGGIRLGGGKTRVALQSGFPRPTRIIQRMVASQPVGNVEGVPQTFQTVTESVVEPAPEMFRTEAVGQDAAPVLLQLQEFAFDGSPAVFNIFVNLPDTAAPDPRGPYYAAYFAPFAQNQTEEPESYDISELLNRQLDAGLWDGGEIGVQFIAIDADGQVKSVISDPVSIGQVRILRS